MNKVTLLLICLIFLTSCATLFTGTKQGVMIKTEPPGATVEVDGVEMGKTPVSVRLKKGNEGQTVSLKLEGYQTKTFVPFTTFNPVAILNLLSLLGWGIDLASGALWKYDPVIYEFTLDPIKK